MVMTCTAWAMLFRAMGSNRGGASLILAGFMVMGATGINDML